MPHGPNNGTLNSGTTFAPGYVNQAFSFDGIDDEVAASGTYINYLQQFTIEAWIQGPCVWTGNNTGTSNITQIGNSVDSDIMGATATGIVIEKTYTLSDSYPMNGGTATLILNITLSSSTSGSGTGFWYWDNGLDSCKSGFDISITKQAGGDGGGGGCFIGTTAYGSLR